MQIIDRIADILELLAEEPLKPRSLSEISSHLRIRPSTCANIMRGLLDRSYVSQSARRQGYVLGPMPYYLTRSGPYRRDLAELADDILYQLAEAGQETVMITVFDGRATHVISQIDSSQSLQVRHDQEQNRNIYRTASGRLLLAYSNRQQIEGLLAGNGLPKEEWPEAATRESLLEELKKIREMGYCLIKHKNGVTAMAWPIRQKDTVAAALGMYLPEVRFQGENANRLMGLMDEAVKKLSKRACALENKEV